VVVDRQPVVGQPRFDRMLARRIEAMDEADGSRSAGRKIGGLARDPLAVDHELDALVLPPLAAEVVQCNRELGGGRQGYVSAVAG
jgi:hypothetical protein